MDIFNKVNNAWVEYYKTHPKERKLMGGKIPHLVFSIFFSQNSYGNVDADRLFVINMLKPVGIDADTAGQFYDKYVYENYAQTA